MNKLWLIVFLLFLHLFSVQAQDRWGLRFSPGVATNRVTSDDLNVSSEGTGVRSRLGVFYDYSWNKNIVFQSGLNYHFSRSGASFSGDEENFLNPGSAVYNLQYISVPLQIKILTNEVGMDTKLYFQSGISGDVRLSSRSLANDGLSVDRFRRFDSHFSFGGGIEYRISYKMYAEVGLMYHRGLGNVVRESSLEGLAIKNSLIALELALKF
ncbi:MAG: PorT family protein [Cyclobacteriaceae bacterium]|nr:PorT family protein [Cyclobacteriaceae bacterium]MCH8515844.1 PorT family protein [Cyclobacteriaceae bacterium]